MEAGNPLLDDYALSVTGAECPRVCFLPSASGDADHYVVRFYRAFTAPRCEPSHISLFRRDHGPEDVRAHLIAEYRESAQRRSSASRNSLRSRPPV